MMGCSTSHELQNADQYDEAGDGNGGVSSSTDASSEKTQTGSEPDETQVVEDSVPAGEDDTTSADQHLGSAGATGSSDYSCVIEGETSGRTHKVALVLDHSQGMDAFGAFGQAAEAEIEAEQYFPWQCTGDKATSRWGVLHDVLLRPQGIIEEFEQKNLVFEYGKLAGRYDGVVGDSCPSFNGTWAVGIDWGKGHPQDYPPLSCSTLGRGSPLRPALTETANAIDSVWTRHIVLVTASNPDTCDCPEWTPHQEGADCSQQAQREEWRALLSEAERIGYNQANIHVIDMSASETEELPNLLSQVAEVSSGTYRAASSPTELESALQDIFGEIVESTPCTLQLYTDTDLADAQVRVDGKSLSLDDPDGFRVSGDYEIELLGEACDAHRNGTSYSVEFACQ